MDSTAPSLTLGSAQAQQTARKYRGDVAQRYEAKRIDKEKWQAEDRIVREMLADLPAGAEVLDVPCGTGRFFGYYADRKFKVAALDISDDMLAHAHPRAGHGTICGLGNIFALEMADKSVDVALSIRIMNLIDAADMQQALRELQRVARSRVIFNLRIWKAGTRFRRAQRVEDMKAAILPGWRIERNVDIHESDFRMFMLCCE